MKKSLLIILLLFCSLILFAKEFTISEFRDLPADFKAQREPVLDMDQNYCAVLRVESVQPVEVSLRERTYKKEKISSREHYLYFSAKEKNLTLQSAGYDNLTLEAPKQGFKPGTVYYLRLDTIEDVDVSINVTPRGANVAVEGKRWLRSTQKLTPGTYTVEISKEGYMTLTEKITVPHQSASFSFALTEEKSGETITKTDTVFVEQHAQTEENESTLPYLEAYDFSYQITSCDATHDNKLVITILITNLNIDDREIDVIRGTRIFDDHGREFGVARREMGNKISTWQGNLKHQMISNVTTKLTLTFEDLPRSANSISLLELHISDWKLPFRNFPISRI
jgi:hypothetical protein